jgi:Flp pilus assembly protein CpaB
VGGLLIAAAAVLVFTAAIDRAGSQSHPYVVATKRLAQGTVIGPGDLTTAGMQIPAGSQAEVFHQGGTVIGRVLAVTVQPGELIQASMLVPAGSSSGLRPVSVAVDPDSLAAVAPGDEVDVLSTSSGSATSGSAASDSTTTPVVVVMRGASLIGVDQGSQSLISGSTPGTLVTLGVANLAEVEAVVAAAHSGTVTLVLAEPSDGVGAGPAGAGTAAGTGAADAGTAQPNSGQ